MSRMVILRTMVLSICVVPPVTAGAQTAQDLVGSWSMASNVNIRQDGSRVDIFGPKGTGLAIFESNGRFAIVNINPES